MTSDEGKDAEKTCCCQPLSKNNHQLKSQQRIDNDVRRISNTEIEHLQARGTISPLPEDDADTDNDDGDEDDVDFRKSIIRINNIYNSCRDMNNGHTNDSETNVFMNNTHHHQLCHNATATTMTTKLANDISL